jgi:hypothetical protein
MEWVAVVMSMLVVFLLVFPLAMALGYLLLLGAAAWAFHASPSVARTSFRCPFSKRRVTAAFLTQAGSERPSDVASCSLFQDARGIRCKKGCLKLAETGWVASFMAPRYALLSGDVAYRPVAGPAR